MSARNILVGSKNPLAFVDPSSIAGLQLWLEAGTLALSDGTAVSSWTDLSGLGNHATQATGANQPLFKTAILNGSPVIRFDGSNDSLSVASLARGPFTAFYVYKTSSASINLGEQSATIGTNAGFYFIPSGGAHFAVSAAGGASLTAFDASGLTLNDGAYRIVSQSFNGTDASHLAWSNGTAITRATVYGSGDPGTTVITDAYYIATRGGSSRFMAGDIAAIIIYDTALSTVNRQFVEGYLRTKYGF